VNPNGEDTTGASLTFHQIDREGKSGIKVLFIGASAHDQYNRSSPQGDPGSYGGTIASFVTGTAGRSAGIGTYVEDALLPDALIANLNSTTSASFLGYETGGQIATDCTGLAGGTFGGRSLRDDVVSALLGLTYGTLATSTTLHSATPNVVTFTGTGGPTPIPPSDGHQKTALTNQHVSCASKGLTLGSFPYLAAPI
jgi:hypothetical protein